MARVDSLNAYEVPRDFIVEHEPFSVENGLLAGIGKYQRPRNSRSATAQRLEKLYEDYRRHQAGELQALRRPRPRGPGT